MYCVHVIATWFENNFFPYFFRWLYLSKCARESEVRVEKSENKTRAKKLKSIYYVVVLVCTLNEACFPHQHRSGIGNGDENKQIDSWWKLRVDWINKSFFAHRNNRHLLCKMCWKSEQKLHTNSITKWRCRFRWKLRINVRAIYYDKPNNKTPNMRKKWRPTQSTQSIQSKTMAK